MTVLQYIKSKKHSILLVVFIGVFFLLQTFFVFAASDSTQAIVTDNKSESFILKIGLGIGGFVSGIGGLMLDLAIEKLVLQMGDFFVNQGLGAVVNSIWTVIRDLLNILFIFSLVYIGLRTIWDSDDSKTKSLLGHLIIAALLINFSLYFAKVVVDVANFTAVQVHSAAVSGITGTYGIKNSSFLNYVTGEKSLSGAYMQVLDTSSWFNGIGDIEGVILYAIMAMFFLMFLGFVLAYGAIMLTWRFIAIVFYLMFSPFMFLGWILPQFQSYSTKWWKGFIGYSFYAPIYIFMLYVGLYSLQQIKNDIGINGGFSNIFGASGTEVVSGMGIFIFFALGVGFLIGAMKVAGIVSQGGAAIGMGAADKFARKWTTGMGKIGAGYGASVAAGWSARKIGTIMDERSAKSGKPRGRVMRSVRAGVLKGETAKFGGVSSSKERGDADKAEAKRHAGVHGAYQTQQKIINGSTIERESAIASASDSTLIEMTKTKEGRTALLQSAGSLKDSQVQALLKSDDVTPEMKKDLKEKRKKHTIERIADGGSLKTGLKNASIAQLTSLDFEKDLLPNAMYLQESQMDDLKKKWDDNETFRILKRKREEQLREGNIKEIIKTRKNQKEIAKLPKEKIENYDFILAAKEQGILNASLLRFIASESAANKRKIRMLIENVYQSSEIPPDIQKYFDSAQGADYAI